LRHSKDTSHVERYWGQGRYYLFDAELQMAVAFWGLGDDTLKISQRLSEAAKTPIHESAVFNALRKYREEQREAA
jgi:hypothetical protein